MANEVEVGKGGARASWTVIGSLVLLLLGGIVTTISFAAKFASAATTATDQLQNLTTAVQKLERSNEEGLRILNERLDTYGNRLDSYGNRLTAVETRQQWDITTTTRASKPPSK